MRVAVTGGAGFIGSHIAREVLSHGDSLTIIDDLSGGSMDNVRNNVIRGAVMPEDTELPDFEVGSVDCANYTYMMDLLQDVDIVVHCAANAREGASQFQPYSVTRRNFTAFSSVASAAIQRGVGRFVLFSSMSVYGHGKVPFHEDDPLEPADVYAVNKAAMESTLAILSNVHGLDYRIIRPHNVFGEYQSLSDKMRNVAAIFMNRIMRGEPLFIYGDGEQTRAFSYIADSLPSFMRAVYEDGLHGTIVNVGGMTPVTVNDLSLAVAEAMGVEGGLPDVAYYDDRPCEVKHAHTTWERSQEILGYEETVGWREGVNRMAEWAKSVGPCEWNDTDPLEIVNEHTPKPWLSL